MRIEQKLSIILFLIASGNLVDCIATSSPFVDYIFYCLLFYAVGIIFLFLKLKNGHKIMSVSLLVIALVSVWFGEYTDLISTTLFCFSIYISGKKIKTYYIYGSLMIIAMLIKFTLDDINFSQSVVFLSGSAFIFIIYQHYIHPSSDTSQRISHPLLKVHKSLEVCSDVVDILRLHVEGYDWPEINDILTAERGDTKKRLDSQLTRKVRDERKRLGFDNQDQFILWLSINGFFVLDSDESDIP